MSALSLPALRARYAALTERALCCRDGSELIAVLAEASRVRHLLDLARATQQQREAR